MIQSDAAFEIGSGHKVCQDYALPDSDKSPYPSVWVSDGCSSSPNTDIGSRLLALAMERNLHDFDKVHQAKDVFEREFAIESLVRENFAKAAAIAESISVGRECMDATLLGLIEVTTPDGLDDTLHTLIYGDGAVIYGLKDGTRVIYRYLYPAGYPFYPTYLDNVDRFSQWEGVPKNKQKITRTYLEADGSVKSTSEFTPEDACRFMQRPIKELRFAAVVTDGVEAFMQRVGGETSSSFQPVSHIEAITELTDFKNFKGEFVHRRMQAFRKSCDKKGWKHFDDLSMAAMYFGEETPEGG